MNHHSLLSDHGLSGYGPIFNLNNDILNLIFGMLSKDTARKASQTCKFFHDLIIPILYHTIDFALEPLRDLFYGNPYHWPSNFKDTLVRQLYFARQISCRPEYASFVRTFSCTVDIEDDGTLGLIIGERWSTNLVYSMFDKLEKVTRIHINAGGRRLKAKFDHKSLFPSAQYIHLDGPMHHAFLTSILHGRGKSPLQTLILQNVFEPWMDNWTEREPSRQTSAGPTRGLLIPSLEERCHNLRHLCLLKQGHQQPPDILSRGHFAFDLEVYDHWAAFIRSVKPSTLVIGHLGAIIRPNDANRPIRRLQRPETAPMDEKFQQGLLLLLKEGWFGLERLTVQGVKRNVLGELDLLERVEVEIDETLPQCWDSYTGRY